MKKTKQFVALLLSLIMMLSVAIPTMAATTSTSKLKIDKTVDGHIYYVYQLIKGEIAYQSDNLDATSVTNPDMLTSLSAGKNLMDTNSDNVIDKKDVDALVADMKPTNPLTDEQIGNMAYSYIASSDLSDVTKAYMKIEGDGTAIEKTVDIGYYVIVDTLKTPAPTPDIDWDEKTISRYMVQVAGETTITPKAVTPNIDKDIIDTDANEAFSNSDKKADTAAIGDIIQFEITGQVPDMTGYTYYYYYVHDELDPGLTLKENSFKVYVTRLDKNGKEMAVYPDGKNPEGYSATSMVLTKGTDYYLYTAKDSLTDKMTFDLAFEDLKTLANKNNIHTVEPGDIIHIYYEAEVNAKAVIGSTPDRANKNTAELTFSNDPSQSTRKDNTSKPGIPASDVITGKTPKVTTYTYVTELTILKTDEKGMPLDDAEFTLKGINLNTVYLDELEVFVLQDWDGKDKTTGTLGNDKGHYYRLKDPKGGTNYTYTEAEPKEGNVDQYAGFAAWQKDPKNNPIVPTYVEEVYNGNTKYVLASTVGKTATHYQIKPPGATDYSYVTDGPDYGNVDQYVIAPKQTKPTKDYELVTIRQASSGAVKTTSAEVSPVEYAKVFPGSDDADYYYKNISATSPGYELCSKVTLTETNYKDYDGGTKTIVDAKTTVYSATKYAKVRYVEGTYNNDQCAFTFVGLNRGEYTLIETKAPNGYNKIDPITFKIDAKYNETTHSITWSNTETGIRLFDSNNIATIMNTPGTILPTTGGMGTTLFYVFGTLLIFIAGVLLVSGKRVGKN